MKIKQIFCKHIYKLIEESFLRKQREGTVLSSTTYYSDYNYYLEKHQCIKCDKIKLIEIKKCII